MIDLNFDYFQKQATIYNEMAIASPFSSDSNIVAAYQNLRKYLKLTHGYSSSSSIDLAAYRYVYSLLVDQGILSEIQQQIYDSLPKSRNSIVEYVGNLLKLMVKTEQLDKPKFISDLKNPTKIDDFVNILKSVKGNRATGREKQIELATDLPKEKFDQLSAKLDPYLKKMNRLMANRLRTKNPQPITDTSGVPEDFYNEDGDILDTVYDLIETLKKESQYNIEESDIDIKLLSQIQNNFLEPRKKSGKGLRREQFIGYLSKILDHPNLTETQDYTLTTLLDEFDAIYETMADIEDPSSSMGQIYNMVTKKGADKIYGYDRDIVNDILPTDELKNDFQNYMVAKRNMAEHKNISTSEIDKAVEDFFKRPGKGGVERFIDTNELKSKKQRIENLHRSMDAIEQQLSNPNLDPQTRRKLEIDYMKKLEQEKRISSPEENEEESTFSYMTEQVKHDEKFSDNPKAKFTERKFKRFQNYNHWLEMNS